MGEQTFCSYDTTMLYTIMDADKLKSLQDDYNMLKNEMRSAFDSIMDDLNDVEVWEPTKFQTYAHFYRLQDVLEKTSKVRVRMMIWSTLLQRFDFRNKQFEELVEE